MRPGEAGPAQSNRQMNGRAHESTGRVHSTASSEGYIVAQRALSSARPAPRCERPVLRIAIIVPTQHVNDAGERMAIAARPSHRGPRRDTPAEPSRSLCRRSA
jgi:hypothetical protein